MCFAVDQLARVCTGLGAFASCLASAFNFIAFRFICTFTNGKSHTHEMSCGFVASLDKNSC